MDQKDYNINSLGDIAIEQRARQLLQVWRDYYAEIFEVDLKAGTFDSLMDKDNAYWATKGFVNIEVILMAEKRVHPDDKDAFKMFFDLDRIAVLIESGIYVTKLNFRLLDEAGEYRWIKVKNIVPSRRLTGDVKFFACFRLVDDETDKDLRKRQAMSDAIDNAKKSLEQKTVLLNQMFKEIKSPLNGIIGMAELAMNDKDNPEKLLERIKKIGDEAKSMDKAMSLIKEADNVEQENLDSSNFESHPVNKITYSKKKDEFNDLEEDDVTEIPDDFVYVSGHNEEDGEEVKYDFSGKRILVVEDNELNVEVMRELLESTGAEVDVAEDGKKAVVTFVSKPAGTYDIVLMDIDIPILDGYSAARCIRISGKDDSKDVPIYAVTSNNFNEDVIKSYELGFNAFFAKPVDFRMLFARLAEDLK